MAACSAVLASLRNSHGAIGEGAVHICPTGRWGVGKIGPRFARPIKGGMLDSPRFAAELRAGTTAARVYPQTHGPLGVG